MANIRVSPNRMELLKLKRSLEMSKRGHKLMKDKLDELLKVFLARVAQNASLRTQVEDALKTSYHHFALTRAQAGEGVISTALMSAGEADLVSVSTTEVMSVSVPEIVFTGIVEPKEYSLSQTPALLDIAMDKTIEVLPLMLELAAREKVIELLALEIESTRRRVNALEHVLIPQKESAIREIRMKLDETDRSERTRLMKVKEMLQDDR